MFIKYFGMFIFVLGAVGYLYALFSKAFAWRLTKYAIGFNNGPHRAYSEQ
jgi:hypothetical protein